MRKNIPVSEHIKTEKRCNRKALKAPGLCNKHRRAPAANLQSDDGSYFDRRPELKNLAWSCHLITLLTAHGRVITILTVFDEHTRECLRSLAADHITTQNVIDELFSLFLHRGIPKHLFVFTDNDSVPIVICEWLEKLELDSTFVELKKYGESGYGVLFKHTLIKKLFSQKSFTSLIDVQLWLANWRDEHNRSINLLRM